MLITYIMRRSSIATVAENPSAPLAIIASKAFLSVRTASFRALIFCVSTINRLTRLIVKKQTSPLVATILSAVCPGLGAAYNGQTSKALIYFAVFVGLFQMAVLTGMALFVLGFLGMWVFAVVDAWRTAQAIRSGVTPDDAQDILVQRFAGNPKAWGIVLTVLGASFFLQTFLNLKFITKFVLPVLLIGLGLYLLREHVFNKKNSQPNWSDYPARTETPNFVSALNETNYRANDADYETKTRIRNWKNR